MDAPGNCDGSMYPLDASYTRYFDQDLRNGNKRFSGDVTDKSAKLFHCRTGYALNQDSCRGSWRRPETLEAERFG